MIYISTSILLSFILTEILKWHIWIKKVYDIPMHKRIKPFDCFMCLSTWLCLGFLFVPIYILTKAFYVFMTMVLSYWIGTIITENKLK